MTEVVDNRAPEQDDPLLAEEFREPAQPMQTDSADDGVPPQTQHHQQGQQQHQQRVRTPFEVVPGLEGDDIIPGLSAKVDDARSTLKNVLSYMSGSREDGLSASFSTDLSQSAGASHVPAGASSLVNADPQHGRGNARTSKVSNPVDVPPIESRPARQPLSFWQRFTCYAGD